MTTANLSEPTKVLEAASRNGDLRHFGTEILTWMAGNVVCRYDAADNVFPRKDNEKNKIDGMISSIMAMGGWIREEQNESVYSKRGIIII
jgi:phage terminase large subunit-like protein